MWFNRGMTWTTPDGWKIKAIVRDGKQLLQVFRWGYFEADETSVAGVQKRLGPSFALLEEV